MFLKHPLSIVMSASVLASAGAFAWGLQQDGAPPMPQASPEHKLLMERVGTWDCAMQMWMGPGEPMKMTGVETNRALGPFHLVSEFEASMMGEPFAGHGVFSWDPAKKKFFSLWVDSTEPSPMLMEGTYDSKTRATTFVGENVMMGERMKMREVVTSKDADHAVFEMYLTGADGKEQKSMQIDYTRRK